MMRGRRNAAVVAGLGPGERELGFGRPLDCAPIPAIRVEAGREDVEVRLRPGAGLALRVVDGDGRPVAGAWVEIRPDGEEIGRDDRETTSPDGSVLFEGLEPAGSFTVTVRPPTGRKDLFPERLRIAGLSPGAREVAFERAWVLEAELRDGAGRPLESVRVYRQAPDGTWEYAGWCNGSGRFRSDPLPPGPVRLRVGSMAPPAGAPPQATVPERADPGEIVLGEGTALRIRIEGWPEGADGIGVLESEAGDGGIARADVGPGGHVLFLGVDPESAFTFFLESGPEGRTAFGDGLVPGADEVRLGNP